MDFFKPITIEEFIQAKKAIENSLYVEIIPNRETLELRTIIGLKLVAIVMNIEDKYFLMDYRDGKEFRLCEDLDELLAVIYDEFN